MVKNHTFAFVICRGVCVDWNWIENRGHVWKQNHPLFDPLFIISKTTLKLTISLFSNISKDLIFDSLASPV